MDTALGNRALVFLYSAYNKADRERKRLSLELDQLRKQNAQLQHQLNATLDVDRELAKAMIRRIQANKENIEHVGPPTFCFGTSA